MDTVELFQRLSLALAIGLLIGLERGWQSRSEAEGERAAGLRTHALVGLLGGVWAAIASHLGEGGGIALGLAFAVLGGTIVLFRYRETTHDRTFGATTAVAALVAFALGALAVIGDMAAAAAGGVAVAGLLALKGVLHGWVRRLEWIELRSALMLAAMSVILLPVLPNRPIDPFGTVNPYEIWLLTVMIGVISFAGYVAIKVTGERRGIALTGLAGGLASSTAVTVTLARLARQHPDHVRLLTGGVLVANATMMTRVLVIGGVVNAAMLAHIVLPLLAGAVVMAGAALVLLARRANEASGASLQIANPLDLMAVLRFGLLLTAVSMLARGATQVAGTAGAFGVAAVSGIADVDAITLSMARFAGGPIGLGVASDAVLVAVAVNTVAKCVLGGVAGGRNFGRAMAVVAGLAIAAGAAARALGPLPLEQWLARLA